MADAACSPPMAALISRLTAGRVPSRGGVRIDLSHPDVPDRIRAAVLWRLYERADIGFIHQHLPSTLDVVELGASLGVTGVHVLHRLQPDRRLLAVEANPRLRPSLNVTLGDERATVLTAALDYETEGEEVTFHVAQSSLQSSTQARPGSEVMTVPRATLTALLREHRIGDYVLVADVEGAEAGLIQADAAALERCRLIIMELHSTTFRGQRIERSDLRSALEGLGFEILDAMRHTVVMARR